jgi:hypothetical protein
VVGIARIPILEPKVVGIFDAIELGEFRKAHEISHDALIAAQTDLFRTLSGAFHVSVSTDIQIRQMPAAENAATGIAVGLLRGQLADPAACQARSIFATI